MTDRHFEIGDRIIGHVSSIQPFGAFIDIDDPEWAGLVLIYQISWLHIGHPSEVLTVGQEVETEVVSVAPERHQISLSIRNCQENPWEIAASRYQPGQQVKAIVTRLVKFGVFACLKDAPAVEGLIPIAELGERDLSVGQVVTLRIAKIDPDQHRISFQLP